MFVVVFSGIFGQITQKYKIQSYSNFILIYTKKNQISKKEGKNKQTTYTIRQTRENERERDKT
jgi:hypothetical protein